MLDGSYSSPNNSNNIYHSEWNSQKETEISILNSSSTTFSASSINAPHLHKPSSPSPLPLLPQDVLLIISSKLDPKDLNKLSITCFKLYQFVQQAWNQWLFNNPRVRILPLSREDSQESNQQIVSHRILNPTCSSYLVAQTYLVDQAWKLRPSLKATVLPLPSSSSTNHSSNNSIKLYSRESLSLPILKLNSKGLLLITRDQVRFWSSDSLKKKNVSRNEFDDLERIEDREVEVVFGSIQDSEPRLFTLNEKRNDGKEIKSTAWDDISCCQLLNSDSENEEEIEIVIGRVNGNLECWSLLLNASSNLESESKPFTSSNVKLLFSYKPSKKLKFPDNISHQHPLNSANVSINDDISSSQTETRKEDERMEEALDGSEIQAISLDERWNVMAVATKKGRVSLWKIFSKRKSSKSTESDVKPSSPTLTSKPTRIVPGASISSSSTIQNNSPMSKNAKKRAKARANKLEKVEAISDSSSFQSNSFLNLLSVWNVPKPVGNTNGITRAWSILLGGDELGNKWVSIGMTGKNSLLLYPIDSTTFKPFKPFNFSTNDKITSVYSLASTENQFSSKKGKSIGKSKGKGERTVIPTYLLFAGCYDGSIRAYDLRIVSKILQERKLDSHTSSSSSWEAERDSKSLNGFTTLSIDDQKEDEVSSFMNENDDSFKPTKVLKDRFDDSAVYDLALGGGEGRRIMAATARNGVVRFFKWEDQDDDEVEFEKDSTKQNHSSFIETQDQNGGMKFNSISKPKANQKTNGNGNGFSLFAAHPSTSSSPTYSLVSDYDRVFGATDTKLWELDFRPMVRLPGEEKVEIKNKMEENVEGMKKVEKNGIVVGSRAYYKHGDMVLENTRNRIGER